MTAMLIKNDTQYPVTAYITLGATDGCCQDVSDLLLSGGVQMNMNYPLQGFFVVNSFTELSIAAPGDLGFNGNFSFNTPPLNFPCPEWPEGVNLAEFIINNGFQTGGMETVDISCVCGANAFLEIYLEASDWFSTPNTFVKHIKNGTRYDNTDRNGVYPYGCDDCTASVAPPSCVGLQPQYANSEPICNVQRDASSNEGGTVTVIFKGFTPVPA